MSVSIWKYVFFIQIGFVLQVYAEPKSVTITLAHPFFGRVQEVEKKLTSLPTDPIHALSCDPVQRGVSSDSSAQATVNAPAAGFKLDQAGYYVKDALSLLGQTEFGKDSVAAFQKKWESGALTITQILSEGETRCPKNALACYYPAKKTLFVDKGAEVGILAPTLYHEIVHSLDEAYAKNLEKVESLQSALNKRIGEIFKSTTAKVNKLATELVAADFEQKDVEEIALAKRRISEMMDVASFKAERRAYDGGYRVQKELLQQHAAYYQQKREVQGLPSDQEIVLGYNLDPKVINKFQQGLCTPVP